MKRFVVDASTLVSGVASRPGGSAPWLILAALLDFEFEAIVCPKLIGEFKDALANRYFTERFHPVELAEIVANVAGAAGLSLSHDARATIDNASAVDAPAAATSLNSSARAGVSARIDFRPSSFRLVV